MSTRKPLPQIAPCPCPKHCKATVVRIGDGYYCRVMSSCGFAGPVEHTDRVAILAWNLRSDAEAERRGAREMARWINAHDWFLFHELALRAFEAVDSGKYKTADEVMRKRDPRTPARATLYQFEREAERRGAMAVRAALKGDVEAVLTAWGVQHVDKIVGEIFQGGEVLPAKKKGARKR